MDRLKLILLKAAVSIALFCLGVLVTWWIWSDVFTYFWPNGPEQIVHPSYGHLLQAFALVVISVDTIKTFLAPKVISNEDEN